MAWLLLIIGGCFEVGFTTSLRFVDGFRNLPWTLAFLVSVAISMGLLEYAARTIPMGTAYAVLDESEIWFKSDGETDAVWDGEGCGRFTFRAKDGRTETMNYRSAPSDVYDDAEAMRRWASLGREAGTRAASTRKKR